MTCPIATALAKLDQAIQLLTESQRKTPRREIEVVIATLESARDDLVGKKPN